MAFNFDDFFKAIATLFDQAPTMIHQHWNGNEKTANALQIVRDVAQAVETVAPAAGPVGAAIATAVAAAAKAIEAPEAEKPLPPPLTWAP